MVEREVKIQEKDPYEGQRLDELPKGLLLRLSRMRTLNYPKFKAIVDRLVENEEQDVLKIKEGEVKK